MIIYMNLFSLSSFIVGFLFGIFLIFITPLPKKTVRVYPTPYNYKSMQFVDKVDNCYLIQPNIVKCPSNKLKINKIPIQN